MAVDSLEVTFDLYRRYATYGGTIIVGVMDDPAADTTFVGVDTVSVAALTTWTEMDVDMHGYAGTGHYIALRYDASCVEGTGTDYLYLSNLQVFLRSTCRRLTSAYASNVEYNAAQVNVADGDNTDENSYMVYYGTTNDFAAATDSVSFSGTSVQLTDLTDRTTYYCWARVQCSDAVSRTVTFSFTTPPPCMKVTDLTSQVNMTNTPPCSPLAGAHRGLPRHGLPGEIQDQRGECLAVDTVTDNYYRHLRHPHGHQLSVQRDHPVRHRPRQRQQRHFRHHDAVPPPSMRATSPASILSSTASTAMATRRASTPALEMAAMGDTLSGSSSSRPAARRSTNGLPRGCLRGQHHRHCLCLHHRVEKRGQPHPRGHQPPLSS